MQRVYRPHLRVSIDVIFFAIFSALLCVTFGVWSLGVAWADELTPRGSNTFQRVTGNDAEDDRKYWDAFYNTGKYVYGKEPAAFLKEHIDALPIGHALDIAMGEGRNAVFLAKKGMKVDGVDLSEVALRKARRLAKENNVAISTINADLNTYTIKPESYDVIVNIDYLQRSLIAQIKRGVKRGGFVVYENQTLEQLKNPGGATLRKDYLLEVGELKALFKDFKIIVYRETNNGQSARASIIAQRP